MATSKHELAYGLIRERIEAALYQPGQRLIIDALARDLNMSQVPIREAIRRLQAEGWITYRHNSGPEIANIGLEQWQATMEVLAVLEGYATALAAPHMRPRDFTLVRQHSAAMQQAMDQFDPLRFSECNRAFHGAIYARCPNPVLAERISETQAQLGAMRGTLFRSVPQRGAESIAEHQHLIDLLEKPASAEKIERAAREHKLHFLVAALRQFEQWAHTRPSRLPGPAEISAA
ncbi:MAG TPA: GntR family transcriptional regulator [Chloroflexota bacterium]|nr:GntR family transcriptional regulator [Chloroflexota bacterium]